jgi:tRNA threonylcarbamoyladenosine biosynthesis protein TsaB
MSNGAVLAIDTAFGPIGVALCSRAGVMIAAETLSDALGAQAEKLPPLVEGMFAAASFEPRQLGRIAVTVGPGAFTGVRVGLAFAKGLALALKIPLLGFTTLQCLAAQAWRARAGADGYVSIIDARRGELYAQGFDGALASLFGPDVMTAEDVEAQLREAAGAIVLAGSGAAMIGERVRSAEVLQISIIDARLLALAARDADPGLHLPVPCYLRAADARLPS